jgi:hypothetical protein
LDEVPTQPGGYASKAAKTIQDQLNRRSVDLPDDATTPM